MKAPPGDLKHLHRLPWFPSLPPKDCCHAPQLQGEPQQSRPLTPGAECPGGCSPAPSILLPTGLLIAGVLGPPQALLLSEGTLLLRQEGGAVGSGRAPSLVTRRYRQAPIQHAYNSFQFPHSLRTGEDPGAVTAVTYPLPSPSSWQGTQLENYNSQTPCT